MKKAMIAMACVLLVIALGLVAVLGFALINKGGEGPIFIFNFLSAELDKTTRIPVGDIQDIKLDFRSDSVTILPATGDEIVLEEYTNRLGEYPVSVSQSGNQLLLQQSGPDFQLFSFRISYTKLYLPRQYQGALTASLQSGSLTSEGDLSLSQCTAQSKSGSLNLQNIESQGDVRLSASSGSVKAGNISAAGLVAAESKSGSVSVGRVETKGDVSLTSKSGSVKAEAVTAATLTAQSKSGSVKIESATAETVEAESSSGSVRVGKLQGQFHLTSKSGSVNLEEGRGAGYAESSSGSVHLQMAELNGDLEAISTSGGVNVTLPKGTGLDFSAETSSGSIHTPFDNDLQFSANDHRAEGQVGENPRFRLHCQASSGSVRVEWL